MLDTTVRFSGGASAGFSDRVAVSVSLVSIAETMRLVKLACPPERATEVVPCKTPSLSAIDTGEVTAVAATPLSVRATGMEGEIEKPAG